MKKAYYLLQTYEIFLKLIYFKLLQEYWTYEWDLWNRLVKVVQYNAPDNGECVEVSYEYDALNHRISRTTDSETTKYAYGRNGALAYQEKTVGENVTKRSFAYLNNEIVGFTDKTGGEESVYYTVTDIQGSITEVYDGCSNLVWKSGYTAFGQLAGETVDLIDFDGMYTGCDYDSDTGLTYHWNRWRSEDGSAFISEDPARDGMNWYGDAGQNPMVYVDRIGLFYYTAEGQQSSTSNTPITDKNDNSNKTPQNQTPNITGGGPSGVPEGVSPMVQAPKDTCAFQESDKSENSAKKSLLDEFFDIFDLCSVGIRDEFSINVPNIFSLSMEINLVSTNTEKGNNNYMDSSLFFSFSIGTENVSIYEFETGIVKKVPNAATPFELFGVSAEPYVKEDINKDFIVTLPIPFVSIELNISEGVDFLEKSYKTLLQKLNNKE